MYKVQMYKLQMYNVQKYNVQNDNVLNMSAVLGGDPDLLLVPTKEEEGQVSCQTPWKNTFGSIPGPSVCPPEHIFCLF